MQTKTCFKLETEMLRNLKSLAFRLNVSMAEIIRQAIEEYLGKIDAEATAVSNNSNTND